MIGSMLVQALLCVGVSLMTFFLIFRNRRENPAEAKGFIVSGSGK